MKFPLRLTVRFQGIPLEPDSYSDDVFLGVYT